MSFTLRAYGPKMPQHSGHWLPNPAQQTARAISSFQDLAGRVPMSGWYDGIVLDPSAIALLDAVPDKE
ncbi:MAG TPA: hypothetical protein VFY27_06320, partial [Woeseiaceae bacterium]|nr:hypothetical protein [Woeseiaceae bacterium]